MDIRTLGKEIHATAIERGWYDRERSLGDLLTLCHCELSESFEEYRAGRDLREVRYTENGKPEGFPTELADVVIRVLDIAEHYGIDLQAVIEDKMAYNTRRSYRHGGKLA